MRAFFIVLAFLCGAPAFAETLEADVSWKAVGNPGLVSINAEGGKAKGKFEHVGATVIGTVECDAASFTTANSMRDEHMRDKYLEVAKFPKITLVFDPFKSDKDFVWTGKLTIKGATHEVKGTGSIDGAKVTAKFTVDITQYPEIGVPSWLGITVAKDVEVNVEGKIGT